MIWFLLGFWISLNLGLAAVLIGMYANEGRRRHNRDLWKN